MKNKKIKKILDKKFDILAKALNQAFPEKVQILKPKLIGECKDCEYAKRTENTVSECNRANLGCNDVNNSSFEQYKTEKFETFADWKRLFSKSFYEYNQFRTDQQYNNTILTDCIFEHLHLLIQHFSFVLFQFDNNGICTLSCYELKSGEFQSSELDEDREKTFLICFKQFLTIYEKEL